MTDFVVYKNNKVIGIMHLTGKCGCDKNNHMVGLSTGIKIQEKYKSFFNEIDLGFVNPNDENSGKINDFLNKEGWTTRIILNLIFTIYIYKNKLYNKETKSFTITKLMDSHLSDIFKEIYEHERERAKEFYEKNNGMYTDDSGLVKDIPKIDDHPCLLVGSKRIIKEFFNPENMSFKNIPVIIAMIIDSDDKISGTFDCKVLDIESDLLREVIKFYRY